MVFTPIIDTILLKVASRCNLNCTYCYVYNMGDTSWASMPKRMSVETINATTLALSRLYQHQMRSFAIVLHGGEPLLLGLSRLRYLFSLFREKLPHECTLNIQTNGTLITDFLLNLCTEFDVSISVSLDGPAHVHDFARTDFMGRGSHRRVLEGISRIKQHSAGECLFAGVLAVIDPTTDSSEVYQYLKSIEAPSIGLLMRDGNHSRLPPGKASFTSTEYGRWLCAFLDIYLADPVPPRVRLLDDMIKLVLGGYGQKEGIGLTDFGILVIDTDGSITKHDTLKSAYNAADRFAMRWSVAADDIIAVISSQEFLESYELQRPTARECLRCPELKVCGGGMPLHRWHDDTGYENESVYCHDQKLLIEHIRARLQQHLSAA